MKRVPFVALCAVALAVVISLGGTRTAKAVTCDPTQLGSCMSAFISAANPTDTCCSKLHEQQPCLCGYINNPTLKPYVDSPNAKRVASYCNVPSPHC
ncbi:hypothetical protein V6N13_102706 [Hibiscus sabdariffa]|uniref:Bifunctional inhibitor/plant lipid transfer protein/seed storage helical domain-containing protein n=2 Tax=Hibiscus sabdariffa TaxID=183260 RepID=A0ABR2D6M5_9ROSI